MRNRLNNLMLAVASITIIGLGSCDQTDDPTPTITENESRWITLSGALMGTNPGDGNGGTMVYSIKLEEARNPETQIKVFENGFGVRSNRTARLQSSEDGEVLFNIAYTGDNGGEFSRYNVNGGGNFVPSDVSVNISQYAGTAPRWVKLFDGDQTGVAVNVANIAANNTGENENDPFKYFRGTATVLALDLQNSLIANFRQYQIPLTPEEEILGHTIFRLDAPVLNRAKNKLIIGTWMSMRDPETGQSVRGFERLGTKSVVVDYPSLENPVVITSESGSKGDCSGYRSFNAFLADDGNIYQATQRDTNGSHILRIGQNNQYDDSYVFSLDAALNVKGTYVDAWRYVGNGIAYMVYKHDAGSEGYVAKLDLNARTAKKITEIPYDEDLNFGQYQGFVVHNDEVFIAVTPVGKDGNIYILNSQTDEVKKGATLINQPGNRYIGVF